MKTHTSYIFFLLTAFFVFSCQDSPLSVTQTDEAEITAEKSKGQGILDKETKNVGWSVPDDNPENKEAQINISVGINSRVGDSSGVSFSYGFLDDSGYVPNNKFRKNNVSAGFRTQRDSVLSTNASGNFITSTNRRPPVAPIFSSNTAGNVPSP